MVNISNFPEGSVVSLDVIVPEGKHGVLFVLCGPEGSVYRSARVLCPKSFERRMTDWLKMTSHLDFGKKESLSSVEVPTEGDCTLLFALDRKIDPFTLFGEAELYSTSEEVDE